MMPWKLKLIKILIAKVRRKIAKWTKLKIVCKCRIDVGHRKIRFSFSLWFVCFTFYFLLSASKVRLWRQSGRIARTILVTFPDHFFSSCFAYCIPAKCYFLKSFQNCCFDILVYAKYRIEGAIEWAEWILWHATSSNISHFDRIHLSVYLFLLIWKLMKYLCLYCTLSIVQWIGFLTSLKTLNEFSFFCYRFECLHLDFAHSFLFFFLVANDFASFHQIIYSYMLSPLHWFCSKVNKFLFFFSFFELMKWRERRKMMDGLWWAWFIYA